MSPFSDSSGERVALVYARPEDADGAMLLRLNLSPTCDLEGPYVTQCLSKGKPLKSVLDRLHKKVSKLLPQGSAVAPPRLLAAGSPYGAIDVCGDAEANAPPKCESLETGMKIDFGVHAGTPLVFNVCLNLPTVWRAQLPPFPAIGLPLAPIVESEFCDQLRFQWLQCEELLSTDEYYVPPMEMMGKQLQVEITPIRRVSADAGASDVFGRRVRIAVGQEFLEQLTATHMKDPKKTWHFLCAQENSDVEPQGRNVQPAVIQSTTNPHNRLHFAAIEVGTKNSSRTGTVQMTDGVLDPVGGGVAG